MTAACSRGWYPPRSERCSVSALRSSFCPQSLDRIQLRGARGRVHSEKDSDSGAKPEREHHRPEADSCGEGRRETDETCQSPAGNDAAKSPDRGEDDRLDEKLTLDVGALRTHCLSHADLMGSLRH